MTISLTLTFILLFLLVVVVTNLMNWWLSRILSNASSSEEFTVWVLTTFILTVLTTLSIIQLTNPLP